ncbi:cupin domain-containing protein [Streptomyces virginiae]|uniref:Cupin domain-containing protein n=1 Tax=Streptomyces virginiae TaxID=1961 RepID=A0ABZ1TT57_STRVG|nr:cupin domain-containing protein [Streptomyces virginiae]
MFDAPSWAERLGGDLFLAQSYFRSHHVVRGKPDDFAHLVSWSTLNQVIATHRLEPPRLRLSQGGEMVPLHRYAVPVTTRRSVVWHRIQPAELHARIREGASLVVDSIDEIHPPVTAAAEGLERFLRTPVQVNAYASWTATEGFGTHWDDHDVVVCQVEGAKRWRIYGPTRQAPTWRDTQPPDVPEGAPLADIVLGPGDLLYLPRGWWHAVTADQGTPSLHLTFGLTTQTGADLMAWVVDQLRDDVRFRTDVPRFDTPADRTAYVTALRDAMVTALDDPAVTDRWAHSLDATHHGRPHASLPHPDQVPARPELTVRLTCPRARLDQDPDTGAWSLAAAGTAWDFAAPAGPALHRLHDGRPATLGELAHLAGLPVADISEMVTVLVQGQAAAVTGADR